MTDTVRPRSTQRVTRRGLEITIPTPNMIGGLAPLMVLFAFVAVPLLMVSDVLVDGGEGWRRTLGEVVGWGWLAVGGVVTLATFAFLRHSNEHLILGRKTLRRQQRMGRIVVQEDVTLVSRISDVAVDQHQEGHWSVCWRVGRRKRRRFTLGRQEQEDAAAVADAIRGWLATPGQRPVAAHADGSAWVAAAETAVSVVSSRILLVIPLLLGTGALLLLALGWQLHEAQQGRGAAPPGLDRVADGELADYRWVISAAPGMDAMSARVYLRAAVRYTADDGVQRTLWLRSRAAPGLIWLRHGHLQQAGMLLGAPPLEFDVPAWTDAPFSGGESWAEWLALEHAIGQRPIDAAYGAARLLNALDEPFHYLAAQWTAPSADWRVAYSARNPDRAMLHRWVEAERAGLREAKLASLWPAGALAVLLIFWTLPGLVPGAGARRWVGRLVVLAVLAALPWWAHLAERLPRVLGAHDLLLDVAGDVVRLAVPAPLRSHAWLVRVRPPLEPVRGVLLAWDSGRSATAGLLRELGLDMPPPSLPLVDSAAATGYMIAQAEGALGALDDDALAAFGRRYAEGEWRFRADALHEAVVAPLFCRLITGDARTETTRRELARSADCDDAAS